jgi:predicted secreted Zn-dependent protease
VEARVNQDESWVVNGRQSDALLHHEQGHYDIFGLMTRELNQALVSIRARSGPALQSGIRQVRADYQARIDRLMIQYDNETVHGTDSAGQGRWDQRISESIRNGTNFTAPPPP